METTVAAPGQTCIRTMEGTFSLSFTFSIQFSLDNKYNSMSRSQINGKMKECIILFNNKLLSATKLWLNEKVFYPLKVCFYCLSEIHKNSSLEWSVQVLLEPGYPPCITLFWRSIFCEMFKTENHNNVTFGGGQIMNEKLNHIRNN